MFDVTVCCMIFGVSVVLLQFLAACHNERAKVLQVDLAGGYFQGRLKILMLSLKT